MGARAETAGGTVFLGNRLLMDTRKLSLGTLEAQATRLQGDGRTVVRRRVLSVRVESGGRGAVDVRQHPGGGDECPNVEAHEIRGNRG